MGIFQADAPEHLRPNTVGHAVDNLAAILRRIDVRTERPLAEGHVDHFDDRLGDGADIGIGGFERGEALQALFGRPA
jgi:hypothetical protein